VSGSPPGILAVARRMARLSIARRLNRLSQRRKARHGKGRAAVGGKRGKLSILMGIFALMMVAQSFGMSAMVIHNHAQGVEREARATGEAQPTAEEREREERLKDLYAEHPALRDGLLPAWPAPERVHRLFTSLAALLTALFFGIFFMSLSGGNHDLGQAGWDMEWLFSFPVRTEGLFLAKLGEFALTDVWTWFVFWPFLTILYWRTGFGPAALAIAPLVTLGIAVLQAALRLTAETWLRTHLARSRLKNVQATATILSLIGIFGAFALAMHPPEVVFTLGRHLPVALLALPWLTPLLAPMWAAALVVPLLLAGVAVLVTLRWTAAQVKDGLLVSSGGPYQGARGKPAEPQDDAPPRRRYRGILGKELRLLFRDRNLLVQTVVVPLFIIGMQFIGNASLFSGSGNPNTAAVIAYGIGAYVLVFGAFAVLAVERRCLWLLYTLPARVSALLRQKVKLWGAIASAYTIGLLAFVWRPGATPELDVLLRPLLALAGVWTLSYVAAGFGVLGTDPFEQNERRTVRPQWAYLYMLVAAGLGYALAGPSLWSILVALTLTAALAWSLWQKADEQLPVLLDPVARPPPQLSLPNGLIAIFLFFVLQGALAALFLWMRVSPTLAFTLAYGVAGLVVLVGTRYALRRVPDLRGALGLARGAPLRALGVGALAGAAAGAVALGWLAIVDAIPALRELRTGAPQLQLVDSGDTLWVLGVLMVVAAPFFEEWLFRAFVYGGMRRSWGVAPSALASALLFAIVHPALGFPAIFGLGLATALVLERTRVLWASMVTHGVYNGIVLASLLAST